MLKIWNKFFFLSALNCAVAALGYAEPASGVATEGFYPIWEGTGQVEAHEQAVIGTTGAHYGILGKAQVGC